MPSGGNILSACPSLRVDEAASRRHPPPHGMCATVRSNSHGAGPMRAEKISMRLTGTRPLLMHSSRLADPLDEITKRLAKLTAKRPKTENPPRQKPSVEWAEGGRRSNTQPRA